MWQLYESQLDKQNLGVMFYPVKKQYLICLLLGLILLACARILPELMKTDPKNSSISDNEVMLILSEDIRSHVEKIPPGFYGYALLPWDMTTQPAPPTVAVGFNYEKDISTKNKGDDYYRYGVDEWATWEKSGFERTNQKLATLYEEFRATHKKDPELYRLSDAELTFRSRLYSIYLKALEHLRKEGVFEDDVYLVIWIPDSGQGIMDKSAKLLNIQEIYSRFFAQFSDP